MFTETLSTNTKTALGLLGQSHLLDFAYLAGGTACALQLGHRVSIDLDFFTNQEFDAKKIIQALQKIGHFKLQQEEWGTILGSFEDVRFSLFIYNYPVLFPAGSLENIRVAHLKDIAAMKVDAIGSRGIKRDFVDLYFICKEGLPLKEAITLYDQKYGTLASNQIHVQKSLVYFEDADIAAMPTMLKKVSWDDIKYFFESETKTLST